jgi:hypothetical protein
MHNCVHKTTWHSFQTVILDKFLTGDNSIAGFKRKGRKYKDPVLG